MSTSGERLATAAQKAPPAGTIICHNSVLYWMEAAGLINKDKFNQITHVLNFHGQKC